MTSDRTSVVFSVIRGRLESRYALVMIQNIGAGTLACALTRESGDERISLWPTTVILPEGCGQSATIEARGIFTSAASASFLIDAGTGVEGSPRRLTAQVEPIDVRPRAYHPVALSSAGGW